MAKADDLQWSEKGIKSVSDRIRKIEEASMAKAAAKRALSQGNSVNEDKVADKYDVYERVRGC